MSYILIMSMKVLELKNRFVTDTGEVVPNYESLLQMARDGKDFHSLKVQKDPKIDKYNSVSEKKLTIWEEGEFEGPHPRTKEWNTPEPFKSMDIYSFCAEKISEIGLTSDDYVDRLKTELEEMENRDMMGLIRHLIFMVSDFRKRNVVWGVGRGSSCASLVLFVIGLNRVDPVKHEIPLNEFLR